VVDIDARALADVALGLGAGRTRAEDAVDPAVGIEILARPGVRVEAGDPLALLHLRADDERALESALAAFRIGGRRLSESSLVLGRVKPKADSSG
jgi:thymidine phosphorylase